MNQLLRNVLKRIPGVAGLGWWLKYQVNSRQFPDTSMEYERRWTLHIPDELRFWDSWLRDRPWPDQYGFRTNKDAELQPELAALLPPGAACRLLDVGAGPLTALGKRRNGAPLDISATDALAERFDALLEKNHVVPPVRTVACNAEQLSSRFELASFDLVFCQNALDHVYDPIAAIDEMVRVLKPAGAIFLRHFENEGYREAYSGLHQWNFTVENGNLIIWNPKVRVNMSQRLAHCSVQAERQKAEDKGGEDFIIVIIRKAASANS